MGDARHPPRRHCPPDGWRGRVRGRWRALHLGPVLPRGRRGRGARRQCGGAPARRGRCRAATGNRRGITAMIVVAGGTGLLGTRLVPPLAGQDLAVRVLTRDPDRAEHLIGPGVEAVPGDVRDPGSIRQALRGASTVVSAVTCFARPGPVSPSYADRDGKANVYREAAPVG